MIFTVTLNPTLDITYILQEISFGEPVEASVVVKTPGGKGLNVSRALSAMDVDSIALSLLGGFTGDEVLDLLQKEGLILQIIKIRNETRTNVIVLNEVDDRMLIIRSEGPRLQEDEVRLVSNYLFKPGHTPEILVLSGSLPPGMPPDTYRFLVSEGKKRGTRVVLDTTGEPLKLGIEAGPYMIKPNRVELSELAGGDLEDEADIVEFCRELVAGGVEVIVASMGAEGAVLVTDNMAFRGRGPKISDDTVGAGDSMVAGLVMGMMQDAEPEDMFHAGMGCGVSAVMNHGPGLCEPLTYGRAFPLIEIERID